MKLDERRSVVANDDSVQTVRCHCHSARRLTMSSLCSCSGAGILHEADSNSQFARPILSVPRAVNLMHLLSTTRNGGARNPGITPAPNCIAPENFGVIPRSGDTDCKAGPAINRQHPSNPQSPVAECPHLPGSCLFLHSAWVGAAFAEWLFLRDPGPAWQGVSRRAGRDQPRFVDGRTDFRRSWTTLRLPPERPAA